MKADLLEIPRGEVKDLKGPLFLFAIQFIGSEEHFKGNAATVTSFFAVTFGHDFSLVDEVLGGAGISSSTLARPVVLVLAIGRVAFDDLDH